MNDPVIDEDDKSSEVSIEASLAQSLIEDTSLEVLEDAAFKSLLQRARTVTGGDASLIEKFSDKNGQVDVKGLQEKVQKEEERIAKSKSKFIYPSHMRDQAEKLTSGSEMLKLEHIPGVRRHWINQRARAISGTNTFWKPDDPKVRKTVGDLTSAFAPLDIVEERNKKRAQKSRLKSDQERDERKELSNRVFHETGGHVTITEDMFNPARYNKKRPGTTKYFYAK